MNANLPYIPERDTKTRNNGITMVMDKGLSLRQVEDYVQIAGEYVDYVKLGFGTALVTNRLEDKVKLYKDAGIEPYFGGTLYEVYKIRNLFDDFRRFLSKFDVQTAEISDGSIHLIHEDKLQDIASLSADFNVLSEVGSKRQDDVITPGEWVSMMRSELDAGSRKVIAEARESGTIGIYNKDGSAKKVAKPAPSASAKPAMPAVDDGERPEKRVPMSRLRQTIAKRLVQAQQTAAMLTTYNEVDMTEIMAMRAQYKETFQKAHDIKLGFMGFFVKAASEALKRFPDVNASIDGTDIVYHGYQDIGVAVSTDRGLVVPVLRDTDSMKIADVERKIADFGKRGRDGKLGMDDMIGGTFTITNGGTFGSLMSTPIINPPQTAILGMHKIQDRPMAVNGKVEIRPMMYLAVSYDHRMIDGKDAVQFLVTIKELLEDPARLLLDV